MKKVLSLVLAFVLVLGMIPTFAANAAATGALNLYDNGFITGKDGATVDAKLDVNAKLTRAELAALIAELYGAKEEAATFAQPADFKDAATFQDWAKPFIAYAQENGWMNGLGDGTMFGPTQAVPAQQLVAVLMNALGYDVTWNTVLADAAALGIVADGDSLTRGEAFEAMWVAVSEVPMNTEEGLTLGVFLGKLEPTTPVVTALEVTSVTATNLKTMVVEFNKAVDADTITTTNVKAVKGTSTNVIATDGLLLSEDGKTLTIVYTSSAVPQSTEVKLTIDGVKSKDGTETISAYTKANVVNDVNIPEVLSVNALNAKQIEVFFSEPMNVTNTTAYSALSTVKIDGVAAIAKVNQNFVTNSIVFELSTALEAKTHSVEFKDLTDYATYKAITKTLDFTVVEDKAAPVVVSAAVKAINKVEVTFDETLGTQGNFWVNGQTATATPVANSNNTKFTLTGFNNLDLGAIIEIKVEYQNQTDVVGNKVSTKTLYTFNVQDDTTIPTVSVEVGSANKLILTFSKAMLENTGTVQILKSTKAVHSAVINVTTFKTGSGDTVLELANTTTSLANLNSGTYYVNIKGMKDATVRGNVLPEQVIEITVKDSKAPEVVGGYSVAVNETSGTNPQNDDTITIYFSEAMDVETLKNLSNYVLDGTGAFSSISGAAFKSAAADGKSVTITLPSAATFNAQTVTVYALKDVAGNMLTTKNGLAKLGAGETFNVATTAVATANNKVVMTFNTPMASVDPSFIKVSNGPTDVAVPVSVSIGGTGSNAGKEVTFTLNQSIGTATTGLTVVVVNKTAAVDIYGQSYLAADPTPTIVTFTDEVSPVFVSVKQKYVDPAVTNPVAKPNQFVIKMSEPVLFTEANLKNDLIVKYADGTPVAAGAYTLAVDGANTDTILVTLAPNAKLANGTNSISVQLFAARDLRDAATNYADVFDATTVNVTVDAVATLSGVSHTATAPTTADLVFTANEAGTYYYLVYATADAIPTAADVKAQGASITKGTAAVTVGANTVAVTGLTTATSYRVHVVFEDALGNLSTVYTTTAVVQP